MRDQEGYDEEEKKKMCDDDWDDDEDDERTAFDVRLPKLPKFESHDDDDDEDLTESFHSREMVHKKLLHEQMLLPPLEVYCSFH